MTIIRNTGRASADHLSPGFLRFAAIAASLALAGACALAQDSLTVRAVRFAGVSRQQAVAFNTMSDAVVGSPYSPNALSAGLEQVLRVLGEEGYVSAAVDSVATEPDPDTTGIVIIVSIARGPLATVGEIEFEGNQNVPAAELREIVAMDSGSTFHPRELEEGVRRILAEYDRLGFPLAKVKVTKFAPEAVGDTALVSVVLSVEEGPLARLSEVRVEGNRLTKTSVILRQAGIEEGGIYRPSLGTEITRRLRRLQLFSAVSAPELYLREGGNFGLLLKVVEGEPNRFDGLAGYVPASGAAASGYVTGMVDVQLQNLFGTARKFGARWQRLDRLTQEVGLRYREPWVASLPVDAEIRFDQRKQDSSYLQRTFRLEAALTVSDRFRVSLSATTGNVYPTEAGRSGVPEVRSIMAGLAGEFDTRDDPVTPHSGIRYVTSVESGTKNMSGPAVGPAGRRESTTSIGMDLEYYVSVLRTQVLALSSHVREVRTSSMSLSDLFRLGGARSLRGYREDQFEGSRVVWGSSEYRILTSEQSFAYAFLDAGYIWTPSLVSVGLAGSELTRIGYGVGLRLDTALGLVGLSLAFGEGDTFSTAKLHLRLENAF